MSNITLDMDRVKATIKELDALLVAGTGIEDIKDHMSYLQKSLRSTPHIVDTLKPEEIGALVASIRMKMADDLLNTKVKATRKPRAAATPKVKVDTTKALSDDDFGDLFA